MIEIKRRNVLKLAAAGAMLPAGMPLSGLFSGTALAAEAGTLTIAYNVVLPSWDPTTGPSAVNPTLQSIYKSVFDQFIDQNADLSLKPGLISKWSMNAEKTKITMELRDDAYWQDGSKLTAEDVVWSLQRAADPKTGVPVGGLVWAKLANVKADGNVITADLTDYVPTMFRWMAFLTGYIMPKAYYEKVGAAGFEAKPIGSGPYMVDEFVRNSYVRLKAFPKYWGPKPEFDTVVIKFVPDATARVAEIESGAADVTLEIPYDEFNRLKKKPGLMGETTPVSNIGMIFLTNTPPMLDKNVRLALNYAINKQALIDRLLDGYGVPIDTLLVKQYLGFDPSIKTGYHPDKAKALLAASGFSPKNPVKFTIQTTRGYMPKDYEMIEAIVGMWRRVGADANIEVIEIAKHYELRTQHKLAPAAFYNWGNSAADPETSIAHAMFGMSPNSAWRTPDLDAKIGPLFGEKDEAKRMKGYQELSRYIADEGYVIPLLQYVQPILFKKGLKVPTHDAGYVLPQLITKA